MFNQLSIKRLNYTQFLINHRPLVSLLVLCQGLEFFQYQITSRLSHIGEKKKDTNTSVQGWT